jgi:predicted N-acetyltransferase YhbS
LLQVIQQAFTQKKGLFYDLIKLNDFQHIFFSREITQAMNNIEVRQPVLNELAKVQQLRHAVLDPARHVDEDHELTPQDFHDENIHMAAFLDSRVVGTVRLDLIEAEPPIYEVRKMAVDSAARIRGIGRRVLEAALTEAYSRGCKLVTLDAREEAIPFFETLGFQQTGDCITHADCVPNYVMKQILIS